MARQLAPSLVVLEDVDLVAEDRTRSPAGRTPLLFALMNEMDGLDDDEDVIFVLTTNRADLLEPALAARPGRVDEAVEIGLPDAACRRRLFDLYGQGLDVQLSHLDEFVERTEGVSAAFIKELMRKAAVIAAARSRSRRVLAVNDGILNAALTELERGGSTLRNALVGQASTNSAG
jgi:ATP-dependent 26S proteasome regulatory subunit